MSPFTHLIRSSPSSSTPPLSHHANQSSFTPSTPSNPTPASPQPSINGEDTLPQSGFGWEFEYTLEDRMHRKQHEENARFQRYERFGMRREEARLPTPDSLREAYNELVDAIENDRTPSLSPECAAADTRKLRRVNSTQRHLGPKATTKKGLHHAIQKELRYPANDFVIGQDSFRFRNENRISKDTFPSSSSILSSSYLRTAQASSNTSRTCHPPPDARRSLISRSKTQDKAMWPRRRKHREGSIHGMITRSKAARLCKGYEHHL